MHEGVARWVWHEDGGARGSRSHAHAMGDKSGRQDVEDPLPPVTGLLPGATERPLVGVDLDGLSDRQGRDDAARPTTSARATAGSKLSSAASGVEVELLDKEEFKFLNDATRHATLQLGK